MRILRLLAILLTVLLAPAARAARIKDVARIWGKPELALFGMGLVTGLHRTGDSSQNEATIQQLANRFQGMGVTVTPDDIRARNVATVMVTGYMPADAKPGGQVDIEVSSIGDASSLEGGVLLFTVLSSADGLAYAHAMGPLVVGGYSADAAGNQVRKNNPTSARVPGGAHVERAPDNYFDLNVQDQVIWNLDQPDFTTAANLAAAINAHLASPQARALDSTSVLVRVPADRQNDVIGMVSEIESLEVAVDTAAKVVINERTGTVVMGAEVRIAPVAVAHGGLSIEVQRTSTASQPGPFSNGKTVVVDNARVQAEEQEGRVSLVEGATIGDLVAALNALGVKPRDLISILTAIRQAGAIHAAIETM
ncbi:MAG: flagellar basal body P-ring protein FlgI [Pseudomonadota bacterium]